MRIRATPADIQAAYEQTRNDPAWTESNRLIEQGKLPSEMYQSLAIRPDILRALGGWGQSIYPGRLLEPALQERVVVLVSREGQCQYCSESHAGSLARQGLGEDDRLTAREAAALAYTRAALHDPRDMEPAWEPARAHFNDGEIIELIFLIGLTRMLNLFNDCLGNRYNGEYEPSVP